MMDSIANTSSKSSNSSAVSVDVSFSANNLTRLRRLKIGECLLSKSISKSLTAVEVESEVFLHDTNYNKFVIKVRNTYMDINTLFSDVKANTCSNDNLKTLDIDDVKGDVLELETKIKTFKSFLNTELALLKYKEQELQKQRHEIPDEIKRIKRKQKTLTKPYKEIIPSPVKALIKSPFKCPEVQQFQDFMANSKNRYGGWNPYSHNLFEITWLKFFSLIKTGDDFESHEPDFENYDVFQIFVEEVVQKIPGTTVDDIIFHNKWYSRYIYLKRRQQRALDMWRTKKKIIKKVNNKEQITPKAVKEECFVKPFGKSVEDRDRLNALVSDEFKEMGGLLSNNKTVDIEKLEEKVKLFENIIEEPTKSATKFYETTLVKNENISGFQQESGRIMKNASGFLKPTLQWNNRCHSKHELLYLPKNINIEEICKRRIPDWRLNLQAE